MDPKYLKAKIVKLKKQGIDRIEYSRKYLKARRDKLKAEGIDPNE